MWHRLRFFSLRTIPHGSPELFWTLLAERSWSDRLESIAQSSARVSIAITRPISHVEPVPPADGALVDHGSSFRRGSHFASAPTRYRSLGERLCMTRITQSATRVASIPVRSPPTMASNACCRAVSYVWAVSLGRCGGSRFSERIAPGSTIETEIPSDLTSWRSDSE